MSEYDSFRFSLSFSVSFWSVFVEPDAAPPVHAQLVEQSRCVSHPEFFVVILMF